jgi:hypothetical protein
VLFFGDTAGNENPKVADAFVDGIDDGLAAGTDIVILGVEIGDPAQGLLRRRDVVALGAEADDRRADIAQVDALAGTGHDFSRGQFVADKQLINDPLDFLAVEIDVATPPFFKFEEALGAIIDVRPDVVILAPQRVGRVEVFKVLDQIGASKLAVIQVAGQRRHPAAAGQSAGVTHRVLAFDAGPIGQRRAGHNHRAAQARAASPPASSPPSPPGNCR